MEETIVERIREETSDVAGIRSAFLEAVNPDSLYIDRTLAAQHFLTTYYVLRVMDELGSECPPIKDTYQEGARALIRELGLQTYARQTAQQVLRETPGTSDLSISDIL